MHDSTLVVLLGSILVLPGIGRCQPCLRISHRPHGRLTCCLLLAGRWCLRQIWHGHDNVFLDHRQHSWICACLCLKLPIALMGDSRFARCLQGGGVSVWGGTVTISSCTITGNTASSVRAHTQYFPLPRWETHVWLLVCRAAVFV